MSKETGGPAFPCTVYKLGEEHRFCGMTLRDYFAGEALKGICSHQETWGLRSVRQIAEQAYLIADIMLKERSK